VTDRRRRGHRVGVPPTILRASTLLLAGACTLPPSDLGDLPGVTASDTAASASSTSGPAPGTTETPTSAAPTSTGATTEPATTTGDASTGDASTGDASTGDVPPDSAWGSYCEYVNRHGGSCEPDVDMAPDLAYPGAGFVVHEWGTDTVVLGSDGATLRGLHHEEEDLPAFVYDRIAAGKLDGSTSVHVKMETPVTYFYSDVARSVDVRVDFPGGVFTQWYPAALRFEPWIAAPEAVVKLPDYDDPVMNPNFPFVGEACRTKYAVIAAGLLDWGTIEVLAPGAAADVPDAPLDAYTWAHARAVAANLLRISGVPGAAAAQHERFLFYRGLGDFPLPLTITTGDAAIALENPGAAASGRVFIVHVDGERGAFHELPAGVGPGQSFDEPAPDLASAPPLDLFEAALAERVTEALDGAGLYHDEALAMVATWRRQWFRSPGLRALYLVPQAWTDASIPLTVTPAPDAGVRVMLIRSELLTPAQEQADRDAAELLAAPDTFEAGQQHFLALGRFAEPRLRRAAALLGDPDYIKNFLAQIAAADTRVAVGE